MISGLKRASSVAGKGLFLNIAERVVGEGLSPDGAAVDFANATEIVRIVGAVLRVGGAERVGDIEGAKGAIGVPSEISDDGLRTDVELILSHAERVGIIL